jgi:hypothetical protein
MLSPKLPQGIVARAGLDRGVSSPMVLAIHVINHMVNCGARVVRVFPKLLQLRFH